MSMIHCPECHKKISDTADSCPKCGHKLTPEQVAKIKKSEEKLNAGCGIGCSTIILVLIALSYFGAFDGDDDPDVRNVSYAFDAFYMSQQFVERQLKAPSTADFCSYSEAQVIDLGGGKFRVLAYVDAENSFGAKIRMHYDCTLETTNGEEWTLENLDML